MISQIIFAVLVAMAINSQLVSSTGDPILLVPGISGSQLNVKHSGFTFCNTFGSFFAIWVSEVRFALTGCFSPEMTLKYDRSTGQYSSSDSDIRIKVPGFGGTETIEELSQTGLTDFPYFKDMVKYFVDRGYERGKSIRGAPYDWRYGPVELQRRGYYDDVKKLVETMYRENGNKKVTVVAHSMGAAIMLHFLTQSGVVTQSWKDQYIGNFITLSAAWAGGNEDIQAAISGLGLINERPDDIFGLFNFLKNYIRETLKPILQSFQSTSFLLPRPSVWGTTVLVTTPTQSYTANDYQQLFDDAGFTDGYSMYQVIENVNKDFPSPNVPTLCFYGVDVNTPWSFHYSKSFPAGADEDPTVTTGNGDGSVALPSSEVCLRWNNNNGGHSFRNRAFSNVDHQEILKADAVLTEIGTAVGAPANPTQASNSGGNWWDNVVDFFG